MRAQVETIAGVLLFCLFLAANFGAQGGDVRFEHLSFEDGLSDDRVFDTFKDSRGFVWFGTRKLGRLSVQEPRWRQGSQVLESMK